MSRFGYRDFGYWDFGYWDFGNASVGVARSRIAASIITTSFLHRHPSVFAFGALVFLGAQNFDLFRDSSVTSVGAGAATTAIAGVT